MTAQPLRLADGTAGGAGSRWLTSAAEMAALADGNWPMAADPAALGWTCFPRIVARAAGEGIDARSVRAAREFTVATLQRSDLAERSDDIATVVSELLTNALRYAQPDSGEPDSTAAGPGEARPRWPIRLGLLRPGPCVLCAVADPSERIPVPREPSYLAETGRGLHVIDALSDMWGYTTPSDMGKVVWAMFAAPRSWAAGRP